MELFTSGSAICQAQTDEEHQSLEKFPNSLYPSLNITTPLEALLYTTLYNSTQI